MKKTLCSIIAAASLLLSASCADKLPNGYSEVKAAKEKFETLDSATVTMVDLSTGEQIMDFSFYFNKNDEMIFSYYGKNGENEDYAYSNGAEFFYKQNGAEGWSVIGAGDENYIYNIYNRKYRYPYATGSIFFADATSVSVDSVTTKSDGSVQIMFVYDTDKLNSFAAEQLDNVTSFSKLSTTYCINPDGYITEFTETGVVIDENNQETDVNVKICVENMNNVFEIPFPVDNIIRD